MKRIIKNMLIMGALFSLLLPVNTYALTDAEEAALQKTIDAQEKLIEELYQQLADLARQTPIPTPPPVAAPKVKLLSPTTVTVKSGMTLDVDLTVQNIGSSYARNVLTQASFTGADIPLSLQFLDSSNTVSSLYEGAAQKMRLRIVADSGAKSGTYPITLTHSYRNDANTNGSETDTLLVKVEGGSTSTTAPKMAMSSFSLDKAGVRAGEEFSLSAVLRNIGSGTAFSVQTSAEGFDSEKIYLTDALNSNFYQEMKSAGQENLVYHLKASPRVKAGSYPITFKLKYRDADGKDLTDEFSYYINILPQAGGTNDNVQVEVTALSAQAGRFDTGEIFSVSMTVANRSAQAAKNVKITAVSDTEGAVVPRSSNIQLIQTLGAGESKALPFSFSPTAKSQTQSYVIKFTVEYDTGITDSTDKPILMSFEQYAGVNVVNSKADAENKPSPTPVPENKNVSAPKIIVKSYTADPILVKAGQQFDLTMVFQNTHATKTISNIKATLSAVDTTEKKGSVFTPVNGSNTMYFDAIEPKGTVEHKIRMYAVPDAAPRTYSIVIKFTFEDSEFNKYDDTDEIGINVKQIVNMMNSDITIPESTTVGTPVYVSFSLSNTGKTALQNLQAHIEGDVEATGSMIYFGALAQSGSTYYEGQFYVTEPGNHVGKVVINYEDDTGEEFVREKEFTITGMEMVEEFDASEFMAPEETEGGGFLDFFTKPLVWICIGGVLAAAAAAFIIIRKRKAKKQKGLENDE